MNTYKYYGNVYINYGQTIIGPFYGNNKKELSKKLALIAKGNKQQKSELCFFVVNYTDTNKNLKKLYARFN